MRLRAGSVLVNCWGGINRSGAVVVAFLVLKHDFSLIGAFRQTMRQRGTVLTNHAFRRLLLELTLVEGRPLCGGPAEEAEIQSSPTPSTVERTEAGKSDV